MGRWDASQDPTFQPAMRVIQSITNANPAVVTTTFDHDYQSGAIVRITVPRAFGMFQIDGKTGVITVTGADTFSIDINTIGFDAYTAPAPVPTHLNSWGQVLPVGEISSSFASAVANTLPH